jgi:predicted adenylyl cyclase CyaB
MREYELKAVVDDLLARRERVSEAGATMLFVGRLEDRRYDTADGRLKAKDQVLRIRTYRNREGMSVSLDWKGATTTVDGLKVREELTSTIGDPKEFATILEQLGYQVAQEIDRDIIQYDLNGTLIRFERYPRMDTLVEVEGDPAGIDEAIQVIGLPREAFSPKRLKDFIKEYEARTGARAVVCDRELAAPSE